MSYIERKRENKTGFIFLLLLKQCQGLDFSKRSFTVPRSNSTLMRARPPLSPNHAKRVEIPLRGHIRQKGASVFSLPCPPKAHLFSAQSRSFDLTPFSLSSPPPMVFRFRERGRRGWRPKTKFHREKRPRNCSTGTVGPSQ